MERGHFCPQVGAKDGGGQKCPRSGGGYITLGDYAALTGEELGVKMPSRLVAGLSTEWDTLLGKALEPKPAARCASGGEMLSASVDMIQGIAAAGEAARQEALQVCADSEAASKGIKQTQDRLDTGELRKRRRVLLAWGGGIVAAVLLLLAGAAGWYCGIDRPRQAERNRRVELARIEAEARSVNAKSGLLVKSVPAGATVTGDDPAGFGIRAHWGSELHAGAEGLQARRYHWNREIEGTSQADGEIGEGVSAFGWVV